MDMPVIFFVDPLMDEEDRLDDITTLTLSYTFWESGDEGVYETANLPTGAGEAS